MAFAAETRPAHLQTLLVLAAARMPGITIVFGVEGSEGITGLRLARGKLEARDPAGKWGSIPHHSSLIGRK